MSKPNAKAPEDQRPPLDQSDAPNILVAARGFRNAAQMFIDKIVNSYDPANPNATWGMDVGEMIASATNLSFAVELYLKGLTLLAGQIPENTHDLLKLYNALPAPLRAQLEQQLDGIPQRDDIPGSLWGIATPPGHKRPTADDMKPRERPLGLSLPAVLERERGSFVDWRYFHERKLRPDRPVVVAYPLERLSSIATVLDARAVQGLQEIREDIERGRLIAAAEAQPETAAPPTAPIAPTPAP